MHLNLVKTLDGDQFALFAPAKGQKDSVLAVKPVFPLRQFGGGEGGPVADLLFGGGLQSEGRVVGKKTVAWGRANPQAMVRRREAMQPPQPKACPKSWHRVRI